MNLSVFPVQQEFPKIDVRQSRFCKGVYGVEGEIRETEIVDPG